MLRIYLSPQLLQPTRAIVHWTWRQVLLALGYTWQEVDDPAQADIAHVTTAEPKAEGALWIPAEPQRWQVPEQQVLAALHPGKAWHSMQFRPQAGIGDDVEQRHSGTDARGLGTVPNDVLFRIYWLLAGRGEAHHTQGKHGFYDLSTSVWLEGRDYLPAVASEMIAALGELLAARGFAPTAARWPNDRRAALAVSHDVDYPEVIRWLEPLRVLRRQGMGGARQAVDLVTGRRTHWHFADWLALEASFQAKSAFYFVARKGSLWEYATKRPDPFYDIGAPALRGAIQQILAAGSEVGLHASYDAWQSEATLRGEKERLEAIAGRTVQGNRHHYWHVNPNDIEETLWMHERVGFVYDSSITHDRHLGWRRSSAFPFFPFLHRQQREIGTLQLPVAWMDAQLLGQDPAMAVHAAPLLRELVSIVRRQGGLFVANVHDYVYDDGLFPGWSQTLRFVLAEAAMSGDFWFATPAEIAEHWRERARRLRVASHGLSGGTD